MWPDLNREQRAPKAATFKFSIDPLQCHSPSGWLHLTTRVLVYYREELFRCWVVPKGNESIHGKSVWRMGGAYTSRLFWLCRRSFRYNDINKLVRIQYALRSNDSFICTTFGNYVSDWAGNIERRYACFVQGDWVCHLRIRSTFLGMHEGLLCGFMLLEEIRLVPQMWPRVVDRIWNGSLDIGWSILST